MEFITILLWDSLDALRAAAGHEDYSRGETQISRAFWQQGVALCFSVGSRACNLGMLGIFATPMYTRIRVPNV